jgi:membrane fusion protein, copper/silver efflux system
VLALLEPPVTAYVAAQEALAADDFQAARGHLEELAAAAAQVEMTGSSKAREAWQRIASGLVGHARHAAAAEAEGEVRRAFEHVSDSVVDLLVTFGNPTEGVLRVAFCPMAFDARGAKWVQRAETIANPYYGAKMLRCGEFRGTVQPGERLAAARGQAAPPAAPPTHQH